MAKKVRKRQLQKEELRRKQKRQRIAWTVAGVVSVVVLIGFIVWAFQQGETRQSVGRWVPSQGRQHVPDGDTHEPYSTDPPTSGSHSANAVLAGFYDSPIPDENIVHNLEHGHIAISYDCSKLDDCETVQQNLRRIVQQYKNWKVIAVPRANRDAPIALTAWQRIELLDAYDEERIIAFIDTWRDKGPEKTPE